jgi:hypothetical protein
MLAIRRAAERPAVCARSCRVLALSAVVGDPKAAGPPEAVAAGLADLRAAAFVLVVGRDVADAGMRRAGPAGVRGLQFYPSAEWSLAACLWESDSVQGVQEVRGFDAGRLQREHLLRGRRRARVRRAAARYSDADGDPGLMWPDVGWSELTANAGRRGRPARA